MPNRTTVRENRARDLARANADKNWEDMRPVERDEYRKQAEREGFAGTDPTKPSEYVGEAMRGRLDDLRALQQVIDGDADQADQKTIEGLDIGAEYDDHELQSEPSADQAQDALDAYPLCVDKSVLFEVVFGTGGPDDRLIFECDESPDSTLIDGRYRPSGSPEIRRVLYRYSWTGSAEIVLTGEDREIAEEFARRVVPELAE